jgi:hypothetical protein
MEHGEQELGNIQSLQSLSIDIVFKELRMAAMDRMQDSRICRALEKMGPVVKRVGSLLQFAAPVASVNPISSASLGLAQSVVSVRSLTTRIFANADQRSSLARDTHRGSSWRFQ